jgi:hypothetical protein
MLSKELLPQYLLLYEVLYLLPKSLFTKKRLAKQAHNRQTAVNLNTEQILALN